MDSMVFHSYDTCIVSNDRVRDFFEGQDNFHNHPDYCIFLWVYTMDHMVMVLSNNSF